MSLWWCALFGHDFGCPMPAYDRADGTMPYEVRVCNTCGFRSSTEPGT